MEDLVRSLLAGDEAASVTHARRLCASGTSHRQIIVEGIERSMNELDSRCTVEEFNLLEIMLCGRAATSVMKALFPSPVRAQETDDSAAKAAASAPPGTSPASTTTSTALALPDAWSLRDASAAKGTVVVGSLEGDAHDLGKNILKTVLTASGYRVFDCGKDCAAKKLVDAASEAGAIAVGVSGLLTTVIPQILRLRKQMHERGLPHVRLMVGGAALKRSTAESLNVDFLAQNAFEALHYLNELTRGQTRAQG